MKIGLLSIILAVSMVLATAQYYSPVYSAYRSPYVSYAQPVYSSYAAAYPAVSAGYSNYYQPVYSGGYSSYYSPVYGASYAGLGGGYYYPLKK